MSKTSAAVKEIDRSARGGYRVDRVSENTVLLYRPVSPDVVKTIKVLTAGRGSIVKKKTK